MSIDLDEWFFSMLNLDLTRRWIAAIFSALLFFRWRSLFSTINLSLKAICELATLNNKSTAINNLLQLNFFWAFEYSSSSNSHLQILIIVSISHRKTCHTYGSISPGRGKWLKSGIFFCSSAVTKRFDLFNFSQLFWRDFPRCILKLFLFWS